MEEKQNNQCNRQEAKLNQYIQYHTQRYCQLGKQIQYLEEKMHEKQALLAQLNIEQDKQKGKYYSDQQNNITEQGQLKDADVKNAVNSKIQVQKLKKEQRNKYQGPISMLTPIAYVTNKQIHRFEASRQSFLGPSETNISIIQFTPSFMRSQIQKDNTNQQNEEFKQLDFQKNQQSFELTEKSCIISNQKTSSQSLNLELNKYYIIQFVFDRNFTFRNAILPPKARQRVGLFSSRAPHRPNPVGQSIGQLIGQINNSTYVFKGLDLLHKTPVLQIQLYEPHFDKPDASVGWTQGNSSLINLYYDAKSGADEQNGEAKEELQYRISNLEQFKEKINFIQQCYICDVTKMVVHKLETSPMLSRTHKDVQKTKSQVLAIGVFRVEYQLLGQTEIEILGVYPAISDEEINQTCEFDDESDCCKRFLQQFQCK